MKIRIKRQDEPESAPYWQTFDYLGEGRKTVAGILDEVNYRDDLIDENGAPPPPPPPPPPPEDVRWLRNDYKRNTDTCLWEICGHSERGVTCSGASDEISGHL